MKKYPRRARNHRIVYCLSKSTTLLLSPLILRLPTTAKLNLVSLYLMKLDCAYSLISGLHVQFCLFFHICFYNVLLWTEHNNYELRCPPVRQSVHFRLYLNLYIFVSHDILPSRLFFPFKYTLEFQQSRKKIRVIRYWVFFSSFEMYNVYM